MIEDAIISGIIQGGTAGIISFLLIKFIMYKLEIQSEEHKQMLLELQKINDKI